jgi:hypothetical protein
MAIKIDKKNTLDVFLAFSVLAFIVAIFLFIVMKNNKVEVKNVDDEKEIKELTAKVMNSYEILDFNTILRLMYDPISDEKAEDFERHFTSMEDRGFVITRWEIENLKELEYDEYKQLKYDYEAEYDFSFNDFYLVRIKLDFTIDGRSYENQTWDLIFVRFKDKWYFMDVIEWE